MPDIFLSGTGDLSNVAFQVSECEHQEQWVRDLEAAGFGRSNEGIYLEYGRRLRNADRAVFWRVKEWMEGVG